MVQPWQIGLSAYDPKQTSALHCGNDCFGGKASHHPQPRSVFLSLRHPHDVQKSPRFGRAKFFRNHDRSGLNHVPGRRYCCVGAFVQVHGFEHGEGMFGDLLIIRISSHGSDSLRPVDYVVTDLRRYTNR